MRIMGVLKPGNKDLFLGTALWGWGINEEEVFAILNKFIAQGGKWIDCATNYPIDGRPENYGLAVKLLEKWMIKNPNTEIHILLKIGAVDNSGNAIADLSEKKILQIFKQYSDIFGTAFKCVCIHWDKRGGNPEDQFRIHDTVNALNHITNNYGLQIGLSGIDYPNNYHQLSIELNEKLLIQVKENILTNEARIKYEKFFPKASFLAYGINYGGLRSINLNEKSSLKLRKIKLSNNLPKILEILIYKISDLGIALNFNDLALLYSYVNPHLSGVIVAPSSVEQMQQTYLFWKRLHNIIPEKKCNEIYSYLSNTYQEITKTLDGNS